MGTKTVIALAPGFYADVLRPEGATFEVPFDEPEYHAEKNPDVWFASAKPEVVEEETLPGQGPGSKRGTRRLSQAVEGQGPAKASGTVAGEIQTAGDLV